MKNLLKLIVLFAIVPTLLLTNCKKSEEEQNQFLTLKSHLEANSLDLDKILTNASGAGFVFAPKAASDLDSKYVIDIRSAADFANGHIANAKNVAFANILAEAQAAEAAGKAMIIVCLTGQTACYATSLLRMAGYSSTQALKWGMSGWNSQYDSWTSKVGNIAKDHANWSYDAAPGLQAYGNPLVVTNGETADDILMERIKAVIAEGAKTVAPADVLANPANYFINNYFSEADYTGFGHIKGAFRISPLLLSTGTVNNLNPSSKIVTYCYTGQTSAIITAFLRVMGYDAYSMTFGMNALYNSNTKWTSNQWGGDSKPKDFPVVK